MLTLSPRRVLRALSVAAVALVLASFGTQVVKVLLGRDHQLGLLALLDVNGEGNVPAWFSSSLLLLAALLIALVAAAAREARDAWTTHWIALSAVFVMLSADEASVIHEQVHRWMRGVLGLGPGEYFPWAMVGAALAAIFAALYWRFWRALPSHTRGLFALAGVVYVAGAVLVESLPALFYAGGARPTDLALQGMLTIEELLEMAGVVLLIHAVFTHIVRDRGGIRLEIA